jgi:hypothetical protein
MIVMQEVARDATGSRSESPFIYDATVRGQNHHELTTRSQLGAEQLLFHVHTSVARTAAHPTVPW